MSDDAIEDGNTILGQFSDQMAEHGKELVVVLQRGRHSVQAEQQLTGTILRQV